MSADQRFPQALIALLRLGRNAWYIRYGPRRESSQLRTAEDVEVTFQVVYIP